ncbi:hypothetical protein JTB14_036845 [Gonioctena quinquepunctata]|nr:hypothetical protein JTB14_036845 [Gonioctena quinquepunctata]
MSIEEDIELRDLVAQTLESNGTLAKIKAQLRASVFLALDEDNKISNLKPLMNNKVSNYLDTDEGRTMFCVVCEFLEFMDLNFTLSVYKSETFCGSKYQHEERKTLMEKLGLENIDNTSSPLLLHLLKSAQKKTKSLEINLNLKSYSDEEKSVSTVTESDSFVKTAADSIVSEADQSKKSIETKNIANETKFNATFVLSPTVNSSNSEKQDEKLSQHVHNMLEDTFNKRDKKDDTFSDTSSLPEDGTSPVNIGNGNKVPEVTVNGIGDTVLKEMPSDKLKISPPKSDKIKPKNSLSNLSDLPPLPLGKSRVNVILPSLYLKESKDKSNLRENDKSFDMSADYEEDFMCSGDDLSLQSDCSKINLLDELLAAKPPLKNPGLMMKDPKQNSPNKIIPDSNKTLFKSAGDGQGCGDPGKNIGELNMVIDILENTSS